MLLLLQRTFPTSCPFLILFFSSYSIHHFPLFFASTLRAYYKVLCLPSSRFVCGSRLLESPTSSIPSPIFFSVYMSFRFVYSRKFFSCFFFALLFFHMFFVPPCWCFASRPLLSFSSPNIFFFFVFPFILFPSHPSFLSPLLHGLFFYICFSSCLSSYRVVSVFFRFFPPPPSLYYSVHVCALTVSCTVLLDLCLDFLWFFRLQLVLLLFFFVCFTFDTFSVLPSFVRSLSSRSGGVAAQLMCAHPDSRFLCSCGRFCLLTIDTVAP